MIRISPFQHQLSRQPWEIALLARASFAGEQGGQGVAAGQSAPPYVKGHIHASPSVRWRIKDSTGALNRPGTGPLEVLICPSKDQLQREPWSVLEVADPALPFQQLGERDSARQRRYTNTKRATKQTVEKVEGNIAASQALIAALGVSNPKPRNWTVCHIWGYDDPAFASQGSIVQDPRYFTCVANMVWLPTPLKGFTDALPVIKTMLRTCAFYLYDWTCEHESVADQAAAIRAGSIPEGYPNSWPAPSRVKVLPPGTAPLTPAILAEIRKRKASLTTMLADSSLTHFPRAEVSQVLAFWNVTV